MERNIFGRISGLFKGYITICVEGFFLEKFANLCIRNNLNFFDVRRTSTSKITLKTDIKSFKGMRKQAKKCGCRIKILSKKGLPFIFFRHRKRKLFAIGLILCLILILVATSFVWEIEVDGNKTIDEGELLSDLSDLGLKPGIFKKNTDTLMINYELMMKREDIAFVSIKFEGVKAKVYIVEKVLAPQMVEKDENCDIIAKRAGLIEEISVLSGTSQVKVGDTVKKGDMLVLGIIEMEKVPEKTEFVHAMANIKARVWYEEEQALKVGKNIDKDLLKKYAYKIAYDRIKKQINNNIETNKNVTYKEKDGYIIANVIVETLEDIGVEIPLEVRK